MTSKLVLTSVSISYTTQLLMSLVTTQHIKKENTYAIRYSTKQVNTIEC